jgi:hypothetical protein
MIEVGMTKKKGCGIGCLALFSVAVILAGAATWYSREINHEYKAVQRSESALLAAVGEAAFIPPEDLLLDPVRLDAFLSVRESLFDNREELEAAATEFAREKDRNQDGGFKGLLNLINSGSALAPVYATYWTQRNESLQAQKMSPREYIWLYSLIYYKWLAKDPTDGRDAHATVASVHLEIPREHPTKTQDLLAPRRLALEASYTPQLNPIELIFTSIE